ncbi:MAG: hypothetical protein ACRD0P_25890 [Stackebrandtia sp.]
MLHEIWPREPRGKKSKRRRIQRGGKEGRTASPVSPRTKGRIAAVGLLLCLALGALAWRADLWWLAIPLLILAAWALVDVLLQWRKWQHQHDREPPHR